MKAPGVPVMQARLGKTRRFLNTGPMNSWLILILAGLLEVCWASSLKATAGFTRLWPSLFFVTTLAGSMFLLSVAVKNLPVGTAYAVWVGVGAAGTALAHTCRVGREGCACLDMGQRGPAPWGLASRP